MRVHADVGLPADAIRGVTNHVVEVDVAAGQPVLLGAGEREQCVDEVAQPGDLMAQHVGPSVPVVHFELGGEGGQRGAQLVRGVGDELALRRYIRSTGASARSNAAQASATSSRNSTGMPMRS